MTKSDGQASPQMIELPEKTYFKIGEVAKLLEVEPYVLRYWETEFDVLEPEKTKSGQRVYQRDDIELLLQIRSLLYEEMFTIAGARRQLERSRQGKTSYFDLVEGEPAQRGTAGASEQELRQELESARQELVGAHNDLSQTGAELEEVRAQADQLQQELALLSESGVEEESVDHQLVADLQEEIAHLQETLATVRAEADEQGQLLRRKHRERDSRRRNVLGSLRREVEALAGLAEPGRNRA